jgi:hypothetical protein
MNKIYLISAMVPICLLAGCASVAVTNDALVSRTAHALGLEKNQFIISDREDDGTTARYKVKTKDGKQFSCYVGGSISVIGRSVSEAICNEAGKPAKNPLLR